ncbi:MAG: hypothetical protein A3K68_01460 [Euryarchaeota archaeon RBG_16_68_13]|nr:MAG: hypothetical protein A3K68_01460 [Euryarchaeota archaeon RBG_16_68_13]
MLQARDEYPMAVPLQRKEETIVTESNTVCLSRQACKLLHVQPGAGREGILRKQVQGGQELLQYVGRHLAEVLL